jgi:hypothetical protein
MKKQKLPSGSFFFRLYAERSTPPAGRAQGIRRVGPTGPALSESTICCRCAAAPRTFGARSWF